ncbi:MAG: SCO family protein [Alphaproteobacteria bacterium]|jgi:cytochrome oxidase Cu insertion factor (SCO1/SenC/PrrC family)|nr:SCO family protein [Alphaproteobacteria bacterium]MBT5390494.1 SCO family protein [Alphaproteobacteria bacterium]MBT5540628.1 SCO family protein [Alphaproteobacteria bacterium]
MNLPKHFFASFAFIAALILVVLTSYWVFHDSTNEEPLVIHKEGSGAAAIGGAFTLIDQNGHQQTDDILKNKLSLIYFGYSYCPDICPTGLHAMTVALDMLEKELGPETANKIQPIFITVDPNRDTSSQLKIYMQNFHPRFMSLTGSTKQVQTAISAYKVYASKFEEEGMDDYLLDHSSIVYIMDPEGNYVSHFTHATPPEEMVKIIKEQL